MTKNVVILDVYANYIESALATGDINISLAMVENKDIVNKCREKFGDRIKNYYYRVPVTNEEFDELNKSAYNLTYDDIEKYRSTQLKCEHYLHREILDNGNIQYRYFMALRFWLDFFDKNKIDMIFDGHIEHGAIWDSIPIDIAISRNIPVYSIALSSSSDKSELCCIANLNKKEFVEIKNINLKKPNLDTYLNSIKEMFSKITEGTKKVEKPLFSFNKLEKLFRKKKKNKIPTIIERYNNRAKRFIFWDNLPEEEIEVQSKFVEELKQIYDYISIKPDYDKKYIYFPLNVEPEATTMALSKINCQIFIIKMLSESIPNDWKIYVKEHPAQFNLVLTPYLYRNINCFRNFDFYNQINKLKNVDFIKIDSDSAELLKKSEAVCAITGTSLIQAMVINKPIIYFGKAMNFIELLNDSFGITNMTNLKSAVQKISEGFVPNYSDLAQIVDKYVFTKKTYELEMLSDADEDFVKIFQYLVNLE